MIAWLSRRLRPSPQQERTVHAPLLTPAEIARLAAEGRELAQRRPRLLDTRRAGDWPAPRLGHGLDFETSRPYLPGDDIRHMDWRTTARSGRAYLRLYREERQPCLYLVIDRGPAMRFGTRSRLKAAQGARVAVLLAYAASAARDSVGASLWDDGDVHLPIRAGQAAAYALAQAAARACPPAPAAPTPTAAHRYAARLASLTAQVPHGSHVALISDFAWLEPGHWPLLARVAEHCELSCINIADAAERQLPDLGVALFRDLRDGRHAWLDTRRVAAQLAAAFAQRQTELTTRLQALGARHLLIGSEEDALLPCFAYDAQPTY